MTVVVAPVIVAVAVAIHGEGLVQSDLQELRVVGVGVAVARARIVVVVDDEQGGRIEDEHALDGDVGEGEDQREAEAAMGIAFAPKPLSGIT